MTRSRRRREKAAELRKQYAGEDGSVDPAVGMVLEQIAGVLSVSDIALSYVERSSHSIRVEATCALWDMHVREREVAGAVATARMLGRDFPRTPSAQVPHDSRFDGANDESASPTARGSVGAELGVERQHIA